MSGKLHNYIPRSIEPRIIASLNEVPVTAILGPRQCGKTTLARKISASLESGSVVYLDLERTPDLRKLTDAEWFLSRQTGKLVVLDEIQRVPELFTVLRVLADDPERRYRFMVLGSLSPELLRQSSETLAGRIRYHELTPLLWKEFRSSSEYNLERHWIRGGFPGSLLAGSESESRDWREAFTRTFLEKNVAQLGTGSSPELLGRLWRMLAHQHGQMLNTTNLGQSLGISHTTVRKYVGILEQSFMLRILMPMEANFRKRMVKTPKVYVRDTGILHSLLEIADMDAIHGHPVIGASWEGWCLEQLCSELPGWRPSFCRTSNGEEIDLVLERSQRRIAFEFKASMSPQLTRGCVTVIGDVSPVQTWVVCPVEKGWAMGDGITVASLDETLEAVKNL